MNETTRPTVVYRIGLPAGEGGRSLLRVAADGTAVVENEREHELVQHFDGRVDAATVDKLHAQLDDTKLWELERRKTAVPGEAPVELSLAFGDKTLRSVSLWQNQFSDTEELAALKRTLDDLIRGISRGEVY